MTARERWATLIDELVLATQPYASPSGSLIRVPGATSASGAWSDGLEGFARTFLGVAFRVGGAQGDDPHGLLERHVAGLAAGVDAAHRERWPRLNESRQAIVEAASIAIGLAETRPWLWDVLDDSTRRRTVDWMSDVVGMSGFRSNWLWFQNAIETFLASVGAPVDQRDLDRNAEIAESLYVGDGWYSDGFGRDGERQSFDWYAGWARHVFPLLTARIRGAELESMHRARLRQYLEQARHLIGSRGAPVLIGRSATYRFAVLAPFSWGCSLGAIATASSTRSGRRSSMGSSVRSIPRTIAAMDTKKTIRKAADATAWNPLTMLSGLGVRSSHMYTAGLISVAISFLSWLMSRGKNDSKAQSDRWGLFIGEWAPTFFAMGIALKHEED